MNERESICADIIDEGLVAIVRVPRTELALPLATALVAGGIRAVELTMPIPNALDAIREIDREMGNDILLGVGTVIDDDTCQVAIDAGQSTSSVPSPSLRWLKPRMHSIARSCLAHTRQPRHKQPTRPAPILSRFSRQTRLARATLRHCSHR